MWKIVNYFFRILVGECDHHNVSCKAKRALGVLHQKLGNCISRKTFTYLYVSKIIPILLYNISVTAPSNIRDFERLEKVHKFACKLICNDFMSSYSVLLAKTKLVPISYYYVTRALCFLYNAMQPKRSFVNFLTCKKPKDVHNLCSNNCTHEEIRKYVNGFTVSSHLENPYKVMHPVNTHMSMYIRLHVQDNLHYPCTW